MMALFIEGMACVLTGRRIASMGDAVVFSAFVSNEKDPLFVFDDAVVHAAAFAEHPLAGKARTRYQEFVDNNAPSRRICTVCRAMITSPDDYLALGHLTDDRSNALFAFNYGHFHQSCIRNWPGRQLIIEELQRLEAAGVWKADTLMANLRHP